MKGSNNKALTGILPRVLRFDGAPPTYTFSIEFKAVAIPGLLPDTLTPSTVRVPSLEFLVVVIVCHLPSLIILVDVISPDPNDEIIDHTMGIVVWTRFGC